MWMELTRISGQSMFSILKSLVLILPVCKLFKAIWSRLREPEISLISTNPRSFSLRFRNLMLVEWFEDRMTDIPSFTVVPSVQWGHGQVL